MSKKFRSQASSARAASTLSSGFSFESGFQSSSSPLSYVTELPDLSQISEPSLVVAFKNLGKRDSTTKAKALEDINEITNETVSSEILQAWAGFYPRTSIDNSRRVRQLAHSIQGKFTVLAGKRIAPLLPRVIGPWIAGTFDGDKSVSRSAQDALEKSFPTAEKRQSLWALYQGSLVEHVEDVIEVQNVATLSDQRTTSPDDANAKYVRVVGTAMSMLSQLLRDGAKNDMAATLLSGKKLWEFVYHSDPYLRRGSSELVETALISHADILDWSTISTCFLSKGLHTSQMGSSRQFSSAILALTKHRPELWTTDYSAKTPISKRFLHYLKQGSQNGPEDVWSNIASLIRIVPEEIWLSKDPFEGAVNLTDALRASITQLSERPNASVAWAAYVQTCLWLLPKLSNARDAFAIQQLGPIVKHFVTRSLEQQWNVTARAVQLCRGVLIGLIKQQVLPTLEKIWSDLTDLVIQEMRMSQPESSKTFQSSQNGVIDQARRMFDVKKETSKFEESASAVQIFQENDDRLLQSAIELLISRNGKPYGAAGIIEIIVTQPRFAEGNEAIRNFLSAHLSNLLNSPSAERLAAVALHCHQPGIVDMLTSQRSANTDKALCYILPLIKPSDISPETQKRLSEAKIEDPADQSILLAIMQNQTLLQLHSIIFEQIETLLAAEAPETSQEGALKLLDEILSSSASNTVITSDEHKPKILSKLLLIVDNNESLSDHANAIVDKLNTRAKSGTGSASVLKQQLDGQDTPLTISTVVELASKVVEDPESNVDEVVPTSEMWLRSLTKHLASPRPFSLAITSPLQGCIYLLENADGTSDVDTSLDQDGFSLAFRLFLYTTYLFSIPNIQSRIGQDRLMAFNRHYPLALQLVNEKLTLEDANGMWAQSTSEVIQEALEALTDGNKLLRSHLKTDGFSEHWIATKNEIRGTDTGTYISALSWIAIISQFVDLNGPSSLFSDSAEDLKTLHKSNEIIQSASFLAVFQEHIGASPQGTKLLNELVADVTTLKANDIRPLVMLNILLNGDSDVLEAVPTQRAVFLLKNLVSLLGERQTLGMQPEVMKALVVLLPHVKDIYGAHWEQILVRISNIWSSEIDLSTINASVKLYAVLKGLLKSEDINEDLEEAWRTTQTELEGGLLDCLQQLGQGSAVIDQPRAITARLVRRQLRDVKVRSLQNIIPLLSSSVETVQTTAYELLHRAIPQQQEQLSVDMILEKTTNNIPESLTELLADESTDSRRYMLAWNLVFDHFSGASHKLQEAYIAEIKADGHISKFFAYLCSIIRIDSNRPIDASKFNVRNFDADQVESPEHELQWLAVHNYYCSLLCTPGLAKEWFIAQKNRIKSPLDSWTQKYISSYIVAASLATVTDWADSRSQAEEDQPLTIKSSPKGSELTATISVDPESPPISIAISLPGSYPLESPLVTSRTRVGVSEKNWNSWLRTIQIIVFSTGSIIEGLIAFKRNVQGALKGQTECAICYSIIGTDMQTPNKKCGTCKNMFHGSCLFKWFKSSNSSSCPLCRNNFNYA